MLSADNSYSPPRALSYFTGGPLGSAKLYLSSDGTETGDWMRVRVVDHSTRQRKKITTVHGSDGTPYDSIAGTGQKGPMQLFVDNSCYAVPYAGLRALADSPERCVFHVEHTANGIKDLDVKVLSAVTPVDEQERDDDPVGPVTINLMVHGVAA